jgi:periplasmic protein TonB
VVGGIVGGLVEVAAAPPPPPPPPAPRQPVRIGGEVLPPALVRRVEPEYPPLAVAAHLEGVVILEATVDAEGRVQQVKVLRSLKFLDKAAIEAVRQWQYAPLTLNGVPTSFVLTVTLNFALK